MVFMGGAVASLRRAMASSDMYGHLVMGRAPCATFMQNAMQVGLPHSLQFFLGESLKISRPLTAIIMFLLPDYISASIIVAMVLMAAGWRMMTASEPPASTAAAVVISISTPRSS